jgi:hypothetical protein
MHRGGRTSEPPALRPVPAAVAAQLHAAEEALTRGDLTRARAVLTQELSAHPDCGPIHYLLGNLDFLEHLPEGALGSYRQAIRLDPGYRGDAALLHNLRALLDDRKLAADALDLLRYEVGKPACTILADVAAGDHRADLRHGALKGVDELGCGADRVASYALDLQQGRSCDERREAVRQLRRLGDPRALEPLRKARQRRSGGMLGLFESAPNECIRKDLDDAIKALER